MQPSILKRKPLAEPSPNLQGVVKPEGQNNIVETKGLRQNSLERVVEAKTFEDIVAENLPAESIKELNQYPCQTRESNQILSLAITKIDQIDQLILNDYSSIESDREQITNQLKNKAPFSSIAQGIKNFGKKLTNLVKPPVGFGSLISRLKTEYSIGAIPTFEAAASFVNKNLNHVNSGKTAYQVLQSVLEYTGQRKLDLTSKIENSKLPPEQKSQKLQVIDMAFDSVIEQIIQRLSLSIKSNIANRKDNPDNNQKAFDLDSNFVAKLETQQQIVRNTSLLAAFSTGVAASPAAWQYSLTTVANAGRSLFRLVTRGRRDDKESAKRIANRDIQKFEETTTPAFEVIKENLQKAIDQKLLISPETLDQIGANIISTASLPFLSEEAKKTLGHTQAKIYTYTQAIKDNQTLTPQQSDPELNQALADNLLIIQNQRKEMSSQLNKAKNSDYTRDELKAETQSHLSGKTFGIPRRLLRNLSTVGSLAQIVLPALDAGQAYGFLGFGGKEEKVFQGGWYDSLKMDNDNQITSNFGGISYYTWRHKNGDPVNPEFNNLLNINYQYLYDQGVRGRDKLFQLADKITALQIDHFGEVDNLEQTANSIVNGIINDNLTASPKDIEEYGKAVVEAINDNIGDDGKELQAWTNAYFSKAVRGSNHLDVLLDGETKTIEDAWKLTGYNLVNPTTPGIPNNLIEDYKLGWIRNIPTPIRYILYSVVTVTGVVGLVAAGWWILDKTGLLKKLRSQLEEDEEYYDEEEKIDNTPPFSEPPNPLTNEPLEPEPFYYDPNKPEIYLFDGSGKIKSREDVIQEIEKIDNDRNKIISLFENNLQYDPETKKLYFSLNNFKAVTGLEMVGPRSALSFNENVYSDDKSLEMDSFLREFLSLLGVNANVVNNFGQGFSKTQFEYSKVYQELSQALKEKKEEDIINILEKILIIAKEIEKNSKLPEREKPEDGIINKDFVYNLGEKEELTVKNLLLGNNSLSALNINSGGKGQTFCDLVLKDGEVTLQPYSFFDNSYGKRNNIDRPIKLTLSPVGSLLLNEKQAPLKFYVSTSGNRAEIEVKFNRNTNTLSILNPELRLNIDSKFSEPISSGLTQSKINHLKNAVPKIEVITSHTKADTEVLPQPPITTSTSSQSDLKPKTQEAQTTQFKQLSEEQKRLIENELKKSINYPISLNVVSGDNYYDDKYVGGDKDNLIKSAEVLNNAKTIAIGDLHANSLKLIESLIVSNMIKMPGEDLLKFKKNFEIMNRAISLIVDKTDNQSITTLKKDDREIQTALSDYKEAHNKCLQAIKRIEVINQETEFFCIGDTTSDRCGSDSLQIILVNMLISKGLNYTNLASNHGNQLTRHLAGQYLYTGYGQQCMSTVMNEELGWIDDDFKNLYKEYSKNNKLFHYNKKENHLYLHAPLTHELIEGTLKVIRDLIDELPVGEEVKKTFTNIQNNSKKWSKSDLDTFVKVSNVAYQEYVTKRIGQEKVSNKMTDFIQFIENPSEGILWKRTNYNNEKETLFRHLSTRIIHGHDTNYNNGVIERAKDENVVNLDNDCRKSPDSSETESPSRIFAVLIQSDSEDETPTTKVTTPPPPITIPSSSQPGSNSQSQEAQTQPTNKQYIIDNLRPGDIIKAIDPFSNETEMIMKTTLDGVGAFYKTGSRSTALNQLTPDNFVELVSSPVAPQTQTPNLQVTPPSPSQPLLPPSSGTVSVIVPTPPQSTRKHH